MVLITDSSDTTELDASFDEADTMPYSVSSGILCCTILKLLECSLLLTSNVLNYDAILWLCFCLWHRQVNCQLLS